MFLGHPRGASPLLNRLRQRPPAKAVRSSAVKLRFTGATRASEQALAEGFF
jgi:hypothetical protein